MKTAGLSLIELLAALAILSFASTMAIGVAGPMAAGQRRAAAINAVEQVVERARLIASARGGAALIVVDGALRIAPAESEDDNTTSKRIIELPAGWIAKLEISGELTERLDFDAAGRSVDARIAVTMNATSTAAATVEILGVSGQTRVIDPDAPETLR